MRKPREKWWGYVKAIIRAYPEHHKHPATLTAVDKREYTAVCEAISATKCLKDGEDRLKLVDMAFWRQGYSLEGAALNCHVSYGTAIRWTGAFIRLVADAFGLCKVEKS